MITRTPTGFESRTYALIPVDGTSRREIRSFDVLHQFRDRNIGVINVSHNPVNYLPEVMGGHVGSHTYGNTRRTIDQQVRELSG